MKKSQLKSTDLNLGDIVYCDGYIAEVTALDNVYAHLKNSNKLSANAYYKHIKPIPLSFQMFLDSGWEKVSSQNEACIKKDCFNTLFVKQTVTRSNATPVFEIYFKSKFSSEVCKISYVHQLQHIIKVLGIPRRITMKIVIKCLKENKAICDSLTTI